MVSRYDHIDTRTPSHHSVVSSKVPTVYIRSISSHRPSLPSSYHVTIIETRTPPHHSVVSSKVPTVYIRSISSGEE